MINKKYSWIFQSIFMALCMGVVMTFSMTLKNVGFTTTFFTAWVKALGFGLIISIPTALIMGPVSRKLVTLITK